MIIDTIAFPNFMLYRKETAFAWINITRKYKGKVIAITKIMQEIDNRR